LGPSCTISRPSFRPTGRAPNDAFNGHARQRHDSIGCTSETRSVGARRVLPRHDMPTGVDTEVDLGMFRMFGRTAAPTKRGPKKGQKLFFFFIFLQHVDDDYRLLCVSAPTVSGEGSRGVTGYSYIRAPPPHFFSEQWPRLK